MVIVSDSNWKLLRRKTTISLLYFRAPRASIRLEYYGLSAQVIVAAACTEAIKKTQQRASLATVLDEVQHAGPITSVCLSSKSDERYIVCGSADATLSVFDRRLNHRQSLLVGHKDQVLTLVVPLSVSLTHKHGQVQSRQTWYMTKWRVHSELEFRHQGRLSFVFWLSYFYCLTFKYGWRRYCSNIQYILIFL